MEKIFIDATRFRSLWWLVSIPQVISGHLVCVCHFQTITKMIIWGRWIWNMTWQGDQWLPTSAPRELRKETERFTGSPEPQAESGWSYDDENDASEESIPLQRNWENYVAWAVNLTAVRRGCDVGMAKQKYFLVDFSQFLSLVVMIISPVVDRAIPGKNWELEQGWDCRWLL